MPSFSHDQSAPDPTADAARISIDRLRQFPPFAALPNLVVEKLRLHVEEHTYEPGTLILRCGSYNSHAFYIVEGAVEFRLPQGQTVAQVRPAPPRSANPGLLDRLVGMLGVARTVPHHQAPVESPPPAPSQTIVLAEWPGALNAGERTVLGKGEFFGEASAISRYPVSTDVTAVAPTRCLLISRYALTVILPKQREFAEFSQAIQDRYRTRTLATHLRQISLFSDLPRALVDRIVAQAELLQFDPGDLLGTKGEQREEARRRLLGGARIVDEGQPGDGLYLVVGGSVKVTVRVGAADLAITYLRKGDYAGELCLLMDEPWPFTLSALEHVELVKIARRDIEAILASSDAAQHQLWETAVRRLKQRGFALRHPEASRYLQMAMDTGLVHGESVLLIDLKACTRCDDCVRACADAHDGTPRFVREGMRYDQWNVVGACYQCSDPVCMVNCPTGAITRALGTLEVTINPETCVGCENCAKSCPWDNITMVPNQQPSAFSRNYPANRSRAVLDPAAPVDAPAWVAAPASFVNRAVKCDLCVGRSGGPACVQMCPHGAAVRVSFKDVDAVSATLDR